MFIILIYVTYTYSTIMIIRNNVLHTIINKLKYFRNISLKEYK